MKQPQVQRKNRNKVIRTALQIVLVLGIVFLSVQSMLFPPIYQPARAMAQAGQVPPALADSGFVAVSYASVEGTDTRARMVVPQEMLDKHLSALKNSGYVTISQQDIVNYYETGSPLPPKALYLMFEDGLKNTPSLVQPLLEKLNYQASIWSYGSHLDAPRTAYLSGSDLKTLARNSFWELGTSGYRLSYINVFDRYGEFVGELNSDEYVKTYPLLDRRYNHYLMDYIRDADEVPIETNVQMAQRIETDYELMRDVYIRELGNMPAAYALMHANTGKFATHDVVSGENERLIGQLFSLNFNREGYALNGHEASPYDLSRMQPAAHWSVNHLLTRLQLETGLPMQYVEGNQGMFRQFDLLEGKADFDGNILYLTTSAEGKGLVRFKEQTAQDLEVSVSLQGNAYGSQVIYLRADAARQNALGIGIVDNELVISRLTDGQEEELFRFNLAQLDPQEVITRAQDKRNVEMGIQDAIIAYDTDPARVQNAVLRKQELLATPLDDAEESQAIYIPPVDQLQRADRKLQISLRGNVLHVHLDDRHLVNSLDIGSANGMHFLLESRPIAAERNQRNVYDPVYDGVFKDLTVKGTGAQVDRIFFSNNRTFLEGLTYGIVDIWKTVNAWFLRNM